MKSKIKTNLKLKKGMAILLLIAIIFSSINLPVFADELQEPVEEPEVELQEPGDTQQGTLEDNYDDEESDIIISDPTTDDEVKTSESIEYESKVKELEELLNKIKDLDENVAIKYREFCNSIISNSTIDISNELQLRFLSAFVNEGNSCENITFNIVNDIKLTTSVEWEPIGNKTTKFKGTFNGNGYTISGITITEKKSYMGLFGYLDNGAIVKNVIIEDTNINIFADVEGIENDLVSTSALTYAYLGGIAGYAQGATITNCINKGYISGGNYVGGIVGYAKSEANPMIIEDCINTGVIKGNYCVGGIAGEFVGTTYEGKYNEKYSRITNCINKGKVYAINANAGGIAGGMHDHAKIEYCLNQGNVSLSINTLELNVLGKVEKINPQNIGGIVGIMNGKGTNHDNDKSSAYIQHETYISKCINDEGTLIYGYKDVGGLVGQLGGTSGGHSVAYNSINYSDKVTCTYSNSSVKFVGSVAGNVGGKSVKDSNGNEIYQGGRIYNCYYYGENKDFNSTNLQKQGAVGKYNGSTSAVRGNIAFKISKDGEHYIWQGRYYKTNDGKLDGIKGKTGFVLDSNTKKWRYAYIEDTNKTAFYPTTDKLEVVPEGCYPTYSNNKGYSVSDVVGASYQPWLNRINTNFVFDANGKAYIDKNAPKISKIKIAATNGNSIVVAGDEINVKVYFSEDMHHNGTQPSLKLKIGNKEYNTVFAGIANDVATFKYVLNGTEAGEITGVSVSNNYLYDTYANKANVDTADVTISNGVMILESSGSINKKFIKQNKNSNNENTWAVAYELIGGKVVDGIRYLNATDKLTIKATIDKAVTNNINVIENPSLIIKVGDKDQEIVFDTNVDTASKSAGKTTLVYSLKEITNNGEIKEISLKTNDTVTIGSSAYVTKLNKQNTMAKVKGIIVDKIAPIPDEIKVSSKTHYVAGETIVIDAFFTEGIIDNNLPKLKVMFGETIGKTNNGEVEAKNYGVDVQGRTVLKYEYVVANEDDGELNVKLNGTIVDVAGNESKLEDYSYGFETKHYADNLVPTVEITTDVTNPTNSDIIKYTFKFSEVVKGFTDEDITINNGIKVLDEEGKVKFEEVKEGLEYTLEVKPIIANGAEGFVQVIVEEGTCKDIVERNNLRKENIISIDKIAPTVVITANKDSIDVGEAIIYTFTWSESVKDFTADDIIVNNGVIATEEVQIEGTEETEEKVKFTEVREGLEYTLEVIADNGNDISVSVAEGVCTDLAGNNNVKSNENYITTVLPTLIITTDVSNPTNSNEITYTFEWSKEVTGFDISDIILPNGVTGILSEDKNSMTVDYNGIIPLGNEGEVTIAVKEGAVKDSRGNTNGYTSNTTKIDRISPVFIGLEAYVESNETSIKLDSEVDTVKQYYKTGEIVTIVATFSENVKNSEAPNLVLQFSESGKAKGEMSEVIIEGNRITYIYTITDGDTGILSVKGFGGKVVDIAGNETVVTKRVLDGDTVIADTKTPKLNELKVVSPSNGTYNANNTIKIEAIYDEEIYALENNEIRLITEENVPVLKLKFGNGEERTAIAIGYGKTDGKEDRTKIEYTYKIVNGDNGDNGDNGELKLVSYTNKENVEVSDIAGNQATLGINQQGNKVTADTISPDVKSITAKVDNPIVSNTGNYHKKDNVIKIVLTFSEKVSSKVLKPEILIGFSENQSVEPTRYNTYSYESDWNTNSTTIEYSYRIEDGDNGFLWVKVPEDQFKDNAGNGNISKDSTRISNVFADTTEPSLTIYKDTEVIQDGQKITVRATFSENVYNLKDNSRKTLSKVDAPKMVYGFGENGNLEASAYSVDGNVITYVITKENTMSGEFYHAYFKGNVYDRAGNPCFKDSTDTIAPALESVEISSNAGRYAPYCKVGTEIYVTATFDEPIEDENMMLKAKVGEVEITELLDGVIVEEDNTKVKFTYIVKAGDMGAFEIVDISGKTDNTITGENTDKTYGWVQDELGNQNNIYNLLDEGVTAIGEVEVDTRDPYITNIKAIVDDKEIATYTKEEGKDSVITVGRTKANIVEYIVTYSERVEYNHFDKINITNGIIKSISYTNSNKNEYKITVQTTVEGVQSLIINEGTVEDKAGNIDGFVRLDAVTVDFTKPTVRFISEYNGGEYVLPTNINKVEIRPNVEISEDIAKIEYKWDDEEYVEIENYSSSSDIAVPAKTFTEYGQYELFIKVEDLAGNTMIASKEYNVILSSINITAKNEGLSEDDNDRLAQTNGDVIVEVEFGQGLTDNRKVVFKSEKTNKYREIVSNLDGTYTITENGIVYAEATDKIGNKVFTERAIINIDKEAPDIEFTELPYGILKNEPVEIYIFANEIADIKYSWDEENWETYENSITKTFENSGEYTLYAKATDEAGNESRIEELRIVVSSLDFDIYGNVDSWTSENVELYVFTDSEITSIKVNDVEVNLEERIYLADENGEYAFVVTDKYGNTATKTEKVDKIDKVAPVISKVENTGKEIIITAEDEGSGIAKYAISTTTEVPVEWSESNSIKTTKDGTFYVWVKDKVGNVARFEEVVTVDTTAPIVSYSYLSQTVTVGEPIGATIIASEKAKISYSWDNENWTETQGFVTSVNATYEPNIARTYTLYAKAEDESGNVSEVATLEFRVVEEIKLPEIIFEDLPVRQINGVKYVKVPDGMTIETLTSKMNAEALCGATPEYTKLTQDGKLRTEAEITLNGVTKYIIVVNGDINCDGIVAEFINDIITLNRYRIKNTGLSIAQILAGDINDDSKIDFIDDIMQLNRYRIGIISKL